MRVSLCFLSGQFGSAKGGAEVSWGSGYAAGGMGRRAEFVWLCEGDWGFRGGLFGGGMAEAGWAEGAVNWAGGPSENEMGLEGWN